MQLWLVFLPSSSFLPSWCQFWNQSMPSPARVRRSCRRWRANPSLENTTTFSRYRLWTDFISSACNCSANVASLSLFLLLPAQSDIFYLAAVSSQFLGAHRRQPTSSECDGGGTPCPGHTVPPHTSQRASQQADRSWWRRLWYHSSQTRYRPIDSPIYRLNILSIRQYISLSIHL